MRLVLNDKIVHLVDDHVDVALRIGHLPDSSLVAIKIGTTRLVVCGSPAYLSQRGMAKAPQELAEHDCIASDALMAPGGWMFDADGGSVSVDVRPRLHVTTSEAAIDAAVGGLGLTRVLCYQISAPRENGLLEVVLEKFEPAPLPINLVFAAQGMLPTKLRAFLDFATPRLRPA